MVCSVYLVITVLTDWGHPLKKCARDNLRYQNLAKHIGLNKTKFKRGFKKLFGTTIDEYSNYHRMQKALELLQTTELSISDIAPTVGYQYQTSFTAAVKHFFGVTLKQLRDNAFKK